MIAIVANTSSAQRNGAAEVKRVVPKCPISASVALPDMDVMTIPSSGALR